MPSYLGVYTTHIIIYVCICRSRALECKQRVYLTCYPCHASAGETPTHAPLLGHSFGFGFQTRLNLRFSFFFYFILFLLFLHQYIWKEKKSWNKWHRVLLFSLTCSRFFFFWESIQWCTCPCSTHTERERERNWHTPIQPLGCSLVSPGTKASCHKVNWGIQSAPTA